jgi:hypothetical protein
VDTYVYTFLATILHHAKCQCIFAGDWAQLPPVCNVYLGKRTLSMRDRAWLKERCGFSRLTLTECRRSDSRLFSFYAAMVHAPDVPLHEYVMAAKRAFPHIPGPSPINLVHCHRRRLSLNAELQEIYKPPHAILTNPEHSTARKNKPQSTWLWVGHTLICATRKNGFRNQWTYVIERLTETEAWLRTEGGTDVVHVTPLSRVAEMFRPPFARTYHSSQGLGFDRVRLWDTEAQHYSLAHLVTGMSRCRNSSALDFGLM